MKETKFSHVKIGSMFNPESLAFSRPRLIKPKSMFLSETKTKTYASGHSDYCHDEEKNSGSIGINMVALTKSVKGYMGKGKSTFDSTTNVNVTYSAVRQIGCQILDFDNITLQEFCGFLDLTTQNDLKKILESYQAWVETIGSDPLLDKQDASSRGGVIEVQNRYIELVRKFRKEHKEMFVAGIQWGGRAYVSLTLKQAKKTTFSKYHIDGNFSYGGAIYKGAFKFVTDSESTHVDNITDFDIESNCTSKSLESYVSSWREKVENISSEKLNDTKILDTAPSVVIDEAIPALPEYEKAEIDGQIDLSKFKEISDSEQLSLYLKALAYNKYIESASRPPVQRVMNFDEWVNEQAQPANAEALNPVNERNVAQLVQHVVANGPAVVNVDNDAESLLNMEPLTESAEDVFRDFSPLGVWVIKWDEIFPWLSESVSNEFSEKQLKSINHDLAQKTIRMDLSSLSKIYRLAHSSGVGLGKGNVTCIELTNEFEKLISEMDDALEYNLRQPVASNLAVTYNILSTMTPQAKKIYGVWVKTELRKCEMGLGLAIKAGERSLTFDKAGRNGFDIETTRCQYYEDSQNYEAFSNAIKFVPYIDTEGVIRVFGPGEGSLRIWSHTTNKKHDEYDSRSFGVIFDCYKGVKYTRVDYGYYNYSPGIDGAGSTWISDPEGKKTKSSNMKKGRRISFSIPEKNKKDESLCLTFEHEKFTLKLYALPVTSAKGLTTSKWRGQSIFNSLDTSSGIYKHLNAVRNKLEGTNRTSFYNASHELAPDKPIGWRSLNPIWVSETGVDEINEEPTGIFDRSNMSNIK